MWLQQYDPLNNHLLSTLLAALPVVVLLGSIGVLGLRIHFAALLGLAAALVIAVGIYRMPLRMAGMTTLYGAAYGLFPIGWLILNVMFLYNLTVRRGQNGLILDRVDHAKIYDNDCSFLSGWGLAMWRSCDNSIARNAFDFCVRGHSEG